MAEEAVDFLALHAQTKPDKKAVVEGGVALTFPEIHDRANRAAGAFKALGVGTGDRVAGIGFNAYESTETAFATQRLQAVGVPINWHLRPNEVAYILNDCGAKVVTVGREFVDVVQAAIPDVEGQRQYVLMRGDDPPSGWHSYSELLAQHGGEDYSEHERRLGATMIYTSGTTGRPKGAFRPGGVSVENVLVAISAFELGEADVHLVAGPGYHSAVGFFRAITTLVGGSTVLMPRFEPEEALRLIQEHAVSTTYMAPTLIARILNLPEEVKRRYDHSSLRSIIAGAAPFPFALKERAVEYFGEVLWEFYGATETSFNTILRPEDQLRKPGSCGQAIPGQEIRLLDDEGNEVADDVPGEVWVRNTALAEYYNRPDATLSSMRDGFFSVGDIASRDADGFYYIRDRKIDMIISGGVNIYPAEIEAVLAAHPAVADAAVIGVPNEEFGEAVKAVVLLRRGASVSEAELIAFCNERLAGYKRPRSVDFVDELPRDLAGKLLKRRLREPYWAGTGRAI